MGYLTTADLKRLIQTNNLNEVTGSDTAMVTYAEQAAITEVKSYLVQKYDVNAEFVSTQTYDYNATYYYGDRFILDASAYVATNTYNQDDLCLFSGNVYYCKTTTTGTFAPADWQLIGKQYAMFYVNLQPNHTLFNAQKLYKVGDEVVYQGVDYTCQSDSIVPNAFQYGNTANIPPVNEMPNAVGQTQWLNNGLYTISNILPPDIHYTEGDNRNQQLVNYVIDVMLYHLFSRIAPRNIPELRLERYDGAIAWLKNVAKGDDITADLPLLQPKQGSRIRWGSSVKAQNTY